MADDDGVPGRAMNAVGARHDLLHPLNDHAQERAVKRPLDGGRMTAPEDHGIPQPELRNAIRRLGVHKIARHPREFRFHNASVLLRRTRGSTACDQLGILSVR
ncbi:MAG: hypothetical protein KDE02_03515, partial [Rhodobacteraceae bacterium]|nr:hypothetical protein [Paracoccaceae bacterium]